MHILSLCLSLCLSVWVELELVFWVAGIALHQSSIYLDTRVEYIDSMYASICAENNEAEERTSER